MDYNLKIALALWIVTGTATVVIAYLVSPKVKGECSRARKEAIAVMYVSGPIGLAYAFFVLFTHYFGQHPE